MTYKVTIFYIAVKPVAVKLLWRTTVISGAEIERGVCRELSHC